MRSWLFKIGLVLLALPSVSFAGPGGPPAGNPILNSSIYQRDSQMWVDTVTVRGILGLPYGVTPPPSFECNVATHTGRIFISTSSTAGLARIYVCEGVNGWQIKSSTGGAGGGGSTVPGGLTTQFQYNNAGSFAGSTNLVNNTSSVTATALNTSTLTVSQFSQFLNVSTTVWQSVSTITYSSGILIDMSRIANASLNEGFVIPQGSDCSHATRNGQICWDSDDHLLYLGNGSTVGFPIPAGVTNLGVSDGDVLITTPTALVNFDKNQFSVTAVSVTTAAVTIDPSSGTLQGNTFNGASQLVKTDGSSVASVPTFNATTAFQFIGNSVLNVMQIVEGNTATAVTVTAAAFTDTNLTVTITPKSTSSKILIIAAGAWGEGAGASAFATISSSVGGNLAGTHGFAAIASSQRYQLFMMAREAPSTTSAVTYKVRLSSPAGVASVFPDSAYGAPNPTAEIFAIETLQ